jgi:hypothetical protein
MHTQISRIDFTRIAILFEKFVETTSLAKGCGASLLQVTGLYAVAAHAAELQ